MGDHLSRPAVADRLQQPTRKQTGRLMLSVRFCFGWGLHMPRLSPAGRQSLKLPFHPYQPEAGGTFLLHYPWSRLHRTLSGILPCEARTFLTCSLSSLQPRPPILLKLSYSTIKPPKCKDHTLKQLPPMNSRIREFLGISSPGIPRK